jgi:hypothetical protein
MLHLTQLFVSKVREKGYMVIAQGDFNRPLTNRATPTLLDDWVSQNELLTPGFPLLYRQSGYYTFNSGGTSQNRTKINHCLHTALPTHYYLRKAGACNDDEVQSLSDHRPV